MATRKWARKGEIVFILSGVILLFIPNRVIEYSLTLLPFAFQYPKIAPKSKPTTTITSTTGTQQSLGQKPQNKLTSRFTVQQQSPLDNNKSRSSTPSSENKGPTTTNPKPLRPYGATASPHEVANAAKMLKRIEDMKGNQEGHI